MKKLLSLLFISFLLSVNISFGQSKEALISADYFGFDFWGINKSFWVDVYSQMAVDSFPFALVGTDAVNWHRVEPDPPVHGVHTYNWGVLDTLAYYTQLAGKKLDLGIRPASNWGTVYPADSLEICCGMSPILPDSLSDSIAWGMTAKQAWKEFVYHLVERYDGDDIGHPELAIDSSMIKTLMIGNEPEAKGHFFAGADVDPGGSIHALNEIFELIYDTAKYANPNIIIVRGKSNPGYIFDDKPGTSVVYQRRQDFFDSLRADFEYGANYYDIFAINYNDHYTSLAEYTQWLQSNMAASGVHKSFLVGDARTSLFPRDNNYPDSLQLLPGIYDTAFYSALENPMHPNYLANKKIQQADEAMQSIKKVMQAISTNQFQISLQPVYSTLSLDSSLQGNRKNMWHYSGFFDPYIYETEASLSLAREPVYWAMKELANILIGANKQMTIFNMGNNIYAYQFNKPSINNPMIIWHENNKAVDSTSGLRMRNQDTIADLSSYIYTPYARVQYFTTIVDEFGEAVIIADTIVKSSSVLINEMPIILYPVSNSSVQNENTSDKVNSVFPNPCTGTVFISFLEILKNVDIEIYNTLGQRVKTKSYKNSQRINITLPEQKGTYFIRINADKELSTYRVLKE